MKERGVIVYLSGSSSKELNDLRISLWRLYVCFNKKFSYPIIIFHEDFDDEIISYVSDSVPMKLQFEKVEFNFPSFLDKKYSKDLYLDVNKRTYSLGYRHMCKFFSNDVFYHPALSDYDYCWRLDTDSFILAEINEDVFEVMERGNFVYGYLISERESPALADDFKFFVEKYARNNLIKIKDVKDFSKNGEWLRETFYTNFEISKIGFWKSREYQHYFEAINKSGGIYKFRWGDTLVHTLAVLMFLPWKRVHKFEDIYYFHDGRSTMPIKNCNLKKLFNNLKEKFLDIL